ncbi:DUF1653 domain-containing protein [Paenibacillus sp. GCM10027626]|uniref:DUF1653 domain-containing protein n=1 Tax=Paenibacillus sp. GCM10027626 TaxID=3273411 RepID=UPI00362AA41A
MRYRHYKGGEYTVINVAWHSETSEQLVIYQDKYGQLWARPFEMFHGCLPDGTKRFVEISDGV